MDQKEVVGYNLAIIRNKIYVSAHRRYNAASSLDRAQALLAFILGVRTALPSSPNVPISLLSFLPPSVVLRVEDTVCGVDVKWSAAPLVRIASNIVLDSFDDISIVCSGLLSEIILSNHC